MLFSSCNEKKEAKANYYPIDSLVNAQAKLLTQVGAVLKKQAEINGEEENNQFTPKDTTAWMNELEIFSELATINKPINNGSYTSERGIKDTHSNLTISSFTTTLDLPVSYLKLFYLDVPQKLRRVEALYQEKTSLMNGSRLLVMEFQEIQNKIVLISYSIEGGQKMFLGDAIQFSIKGSITLP